MTHNRIFVEFLIFLFWEEPFQLIPWAMDPNVLLNAGIVAFLDERPADPISFLADL